MIRPVLTSGSDFFNADQGGDPALFQHALWFFGHPEFWLSILALLINFVVIFALCHQSHIGKALSVIWLGTILYAVLTKFHYFKTMDPLTTSQMTLINFIYIGIILVAIGGGLWGMAKAITRREHSKGFKEQ
jgi:cytochrome c oxidase subunit 1